MLGEIRQGVLEEGPKGKKLKLQVADVICNPVDNAEVGALIVMEGMATKHPPSVFRDTQGRLVIRFWHEI